jgi:hypothetical protein
MGKHERNRREKRKISSEGDNNGQSQKAGRLSNLNSADSLSVSDILHKTNSVLYNDETLNLSDVFYKESSPETNSGNMATPTSTQKSDMATTSNCPKDPSNADIVTYLKRIDDRLSLMDKKFEEIDKIGKNVEGVNGDLKKIWAYLHDIDKKTSERLSLIEEKTESVDFALAQASSKISSLEKQRDELKNDLTYLQSQSMRSNLVFTNIPEDPTENPDTTENKLRDFMVDKMKIAQDLVNQMSFERVHRMGPKVDGKIRTIVAKFTLYKEKEFVRKQWKTLNGTPYFVNEQFPKDIVDKRKQLVPKMKEARRDGKTSWISYDTLYINGKPVRE